MTAVERELREYVDKQWPPGHEATKEAAIAFLLKGLMEGKPLPRVESLFDLYGDLLDL